MENGSCWVKEYDTKVALFVDDSWSELSDQEDDWARGHVTDTRDTTCLVQIEPFSVFSLPDWGTSNQLKHGVGPVLG